MNEIDCFYHVAGSYGPPKLIKVDVDELDKVRELINCDAIDIVQRKIGSRVYHIICDDEALLKKNPVPATFDFSTFRVDIFGNILICSGEINGDELVGLNEEEQKEVRMYSNFHIFLDEKTEVSLVIVGG